MKAKVLKRRKIVLGLVGLLAGWGIAEIILQMVGVAVAAGMRTKYPVFDQSVLYEYDPLLGWKLRPGSHARQYIPDFDVTYVINEQGCRDDRPYRKEATTRRVAVLGDSFAFGVGVSNQYTFAKRLERAANVDVLNFGVSGYDVGQYYLQLKETVAAYKPDILLCSVYLGNDIGDVICDRLPGSGKAKPFFSFREGKLVLHNSPVKYETALQTAANVNAPDYRVRQDRMIRHLTWFLKLKTVGLAAGFVGSRCYPLVARLGIVKRVEDYEANFAIIRSLIRGMKEVLGEQQRFIVLLVPSRNIRSNYMEQRFAEKMVDIVRSAGVEYANFVNVAQVRDGLYFPDEGHLNEKGHEAVAELLAAIIGSERNGESQGEWDD